MSIHRRIYIIAGVLAAAGCAAKAQDTPPAEQELPSLDALLGLPEEAPAGDAAREALDRALSPEEAGEEFEQAVVLMDQTASRLNDAGDAGLQTQRLQEDILRKLDKLIESAEQNQQQRQSRSRQRQQQQQQQQQQQAGAQQSQQQQAQNNSGARASDSTAETNPEGQAAQPRALEAQAAAAWGRLPEHVRQALVQGLSDRFSSMYQQMTEAYYRRLAEDPDAEGAR